MRRPRSSSPRRLGALLLSIACALGTGCRQESDRSGRDRGPVPSLAEDFELDLLGWTLCGASPPARAPGGNPGQCLEFPPQDSEAIIGDGTGTRYQWDVSCTYDSTGPSFFAGISSGMDCFDPVADTRLAGFLLDPGANTVELVHQDIVIGSAPADLAGGRYVRLRLDRDLGTLSYRVDGAVVGEAADPGAGSPHFQTWSPGGAQNGVARVDNLEIRKPFK